MLSLHYNQIYAICLRLTNNEADGQDAAQEALIAVAKGIPRFTGKSKFSTWVYRVATNTALSELRRRSRRPIVGLPERKDAEQFAWGNNKAGDPAGVVVDRLQLHKALVELPEVFRAAVVLRDVVGFSYEEIGEILKIPLGTVRSRIARGRAGLAKAIYPQ